MALSLSCSCGARLEIDEKFAGQGITCPDCQRPLRVPALIQPYFRTSGLALASLLCALIGAFTVIGTLVAVGLGFLALRQIARQPDRLQGLRLAWAGIVLGGAFTVLTLIAHVGMEWLGLDRWLREPEWAGKLEYAGPTEIRLDKNLFSLTRPSSRWGVLRAAKDLDGRNDLILVDVADDAQVICLSHLLQRPEDMDFCRGQAVQKIIDSELARLLNRNQVSSPATKVLSNKTLAAGDDQEKEEVLVNLLLGGRDRTFLMYILRAKVRDDYRLFVVAGGTRASRFAHLEGELRKILDSFKLEP